MSRGIAGRAHDAVLDWVLRYTRDLPGGLARDRFDEIRSDLWEQAAADRHGGTGPRFAVELLLRAARGVPADLSWRRAQLAGAGSEATAGRQAPPAPKRWVPLGDAVLFDQTNGTAPASTGEAERDGDDVEQRLIGQAAASNMVNVGFFSGF